MVRWISRIFWLAVLVAMALFMVANKETVAVNFDPIGLGYEFLQPRTMPLYGVMMISLTIGLILGLLFLRVAYVPVRRSERDNARQVVLLKRENERMRQSLKAMDSADSVRPSTNLPARRA